ncbi:hypothetical protein DL546_008065 [Coniochaeta pulveracea]|uniref:Uncharacterized protein n=1 Tax=Coniochaeta pulveracea TaxID=177199 RepID=A0A420YLU1_9PEZI|nr:hypothetical protein DL546_008065 [Coniochaeta pulveracea]
MDALAHLVANIPDWIKRLDELTDQIEKRQLELAQVSSSPMPRTRSLRNRGSTESLKPTDEPEAHPQDTVAELPQAPVTKPTTPVKHPLDTSVTPAKAADGPPPSSPGGSNTPSGLRRQTSVVKAQAQARVRATMRKRQRSDSIVSAEAGVPKFRTRSMIIVYYDSYVQSFFEELVKFVSASRNMMRKAKMAAKVAQIKRQAELALGDGDDEQQDAPKDQGLQVGGQLLAAQVGKSPSVQVDDAPLEAVPASEDAKAREEDEKLALQFVSSRRMRPVTRIPNAFGTATGRHAYASGSRVAGGGQQAAAGQLPDVYDRLDKGLEYVQSMSEHGAHQFLRDGDCAEEVDNIKTKLAETKDLAAKEMERVQKDEPAELKSSSDSLKGRSFRPHSMRREYSGPSMKDGNVDLEVDDGPEGNSAGEGKLLAKGTRLMQ